MKKTSVLKLILTPILLVFGMNSNAQLFPNGDFELGTGAGCACAASFTCGNDAGRVIDGTHPVFVVGNQGCISSATNYSPQLGAHGGQGTIYFYAGGDNYDGQAVNFAGGEEVCLSVWYTGTQGSGASGQNTANSHFSFKLDGSQIGPDVQVPVNTPWTEHTFTVIMTAGNHTFGILSGGAAQYSIWTDDFQANLCTVGCDASWTSTTACSTDPPINLDLLITGDTGGAWTGTGVTGNMFDPASGTQSITYTAPGACLIAQNITVTTTAVGTWTLPANLCTTSPQVDLNTLITGTAGGAWSGTGVTGNMFDPAGGSQTVTYTVGTTPCDDAVAQLITVSSAAAATWTNPGPLCEADGAIDLSLLITGTAGGTWAGTGVTGTSFDPTGLSGNISVTYTVGTAPCDATLIQDINVISVADATWVPPTGLCSSSPLFDLSTTITGTAGGIWSGTGVTGTNFDPAGGTQTVTYTVGSGSCQQLLALSITVGAGANPAWTTFNICASDAPVNLDNSITGDLGGTWSGTGVTGNVFDPFFGTQSVTYTVGAVGCQSTSSQTITVVDPQLTATGTNVSCFGLTDGGMNVTVTGGSGTYTYTWNTVPAQTTQTATNVVAGAYTITVLDGTCSAIDSVTIIEPAEITGTMTATVGCQPTLGSASIVAAGGVGGFTYAWNNSTQTTATATDLDSNMHIVTVTDANGCTFNDSILVQTFPSPVVTTIADTTIIYGNCINLPATGAASYSWTPNSELNCDNCQSPEACSTILTTYCVTGIDTNGCSNTDCVTIDVEIICGDVFVPSAFSPNDDNENDLECVYSDCMEYMTFSVYNRWGEKVFETNNMNICWDGTWKGNQLNSAVFVYVLEGALINGEIVSQKGNISLIR